MQPVPSKRSSISCMTYPQQEMLHLLQHNGTHPLLSCTILQHAWCRLTNRTGMQCTGSKCRHSGEKPHSAASRVHAFTGRVHGEGIR